MHQEASTLTENVTAATPITLIDKAKTILQRVGLTVSSRDSQATQPLAVEMQDLMVVDEPGVMAISRVLAAAPGFNEVVRNEVAAMKVGDRYKKIAAAFDSIREDGESLVRQLDDGHIDFRERLANSWMNLTRGSISHRFDTIRETADAVFHDSEQQVERTHAILDAYSSFRLGMKQAVVKATAIQASTQTRLDDAKAALANAQAAVDAASEDPVAKAEAELKRDVALKSFQDEDRRFQKAKNLAENLSNSHNVSDVVMARVNQTLQVHEQVLSQARTFMATNETVLTALNASFTSTKSLHESAETLDVLRNSINKGLESQADVGTRVQEQALRSALGPGIKAESVKRLVDSIVDFQRRSIQLTEELRQQSTRATDEISHEVEAGRKRLADIMTGGQG